MTQGIFAALEHLEERIMNINPKTDTHSGFVAIQRDDGLSVELDERSNNNRYFEFQIDTFPEDDGQAGLSGRKRATIDLRVRYEIPTSYGFLSRMIAEDASNLLDSLKSPDYDYIDTGIINAIPERPTFEAITNATGERVAFILTIPFTLLFLEN